MLMQKKRLVQFDVCHFYEVFYCASFRHIYPRYKTKVLKALSSILFIYTYIILQWAWNIRIPWNKTHLIYQVLYMLLGKKVLTKLKILKVGYNLLEKWRRKKSQENLLKMITNSNTLLWLIMITQPNITCTRRPY